MSPLFFNYQTNVKLKILIQNHYICEKLFCMKRVVLILLTLFTALSVYAQEVTFDVKAPTAPIVAGESMHVEFAVTWKGQEGRVGDFVQPNFEGAAILYGPSESRSTSLQIINGKTHKSNTQSYTFVISYDTPGDYVIDAASVVVNGVTYKTIPYKMTIIKETPRPASKASISTVESEMVEYNTFRGIPIAGHLDDFCNSLSNLGYQQTLFYSKQHSASAEFSGKYGGESCKIYVYTSAISNTVYAVRVLIERPTWQTIKQIYLKFKSLFEGKFGKPLKVTEKFTTPYKDGDGQEFSALQNGNGTYLSIFDSTPTGLGSVNLVVGVTTRREGYIRIDFVDYKNEKLNEQEIRESI